MEHAEEERGDEPGDRDAVAGAQGSEDHAPAEELLEERRQHDQRKDGPQAAPEIDFQVGQQPQQRFEDDADGEDQHEGPQQQRGVEPAEREMRPGPAAAAEMAVIEHPGQRDGHRHEVEDGGHPGQDVRGGRLEVESVCGGQQLPDHPDDDLHRKGDAQHGQQVPDRGKAACRGTDFRGGDSGCGFRHMLRRFLFNLFLHDAYGSENLPDLPSGAASGSERRPGSPGLRDVAPGIPEDSARRRPPKASACGAVPARNRSKDTKNSVKRPGRREILAAIAAEAPPVRFPAGFSGNHPAGFARAILFA